MHGEEPHVERDVVLLGEAGFAVVGTLNSPLSLIPFSLVVGAAGPVHDLLSDTVACQHRLSSSFVTVGAVVVLGFQLAATLVSNFALTYCFMSEGRIRR